MKSVKHMQAFITNEAGRIHIKEVQATGHMVVTFRIKQLPIEITIQETIVKQTQAILQVLISKGIVDNSSVRYPGNFSLTTDSTRVAKISIIERETHGEKHHQRTKHVEGVICETKDFYGKVQEANPFIYAVVLLKAEKGQEVSQIVHYRTTQGRENRAYLTKAYDC